jgi:serine/threonine protein kinase/tetratricopeptide (TPR) repeat protein
MMAETHRDLDKASETQRATGVSGFYNATASSASGSSFAERLGFGKACRPSVDTKLGPRECCGFELDPADQSNISGYEDSLSAWSVISPSGMPQGEYRVDSIQRGDDEHAGGGRGLNVALGQTVAVIRDRADAEFATGPGAIDRSPSSVHARLKPPEVPGYEIFEELGRGGMGVVYKARQRRLNRVVALKMILAGDYAGPDAIERIMAEAEIAARLQHPNIVQVYANGDCDGRPYVVLEYVGGGSLADRLDGTPWPPRAAARLIASIAGAMAEAHRMGVIHRDLKPANILMTDDGVPKITDFGLAKSIENSSGLTRTESILGSPRYMAPEQAEGRTREVGPAADVYAIGTNLYELLTGRPPFVAPTVLATLDLVKNAEPVAPRRLQPGLASDLETICLKCLRKEPGERYESADALAEDLNRYLNGEPILARPTSSWERGWKWVRRHPTLAALIVVSTLSIVAAIAGLCWYRADLNRQRQLVERRIERVRGEVQQFAMLGEEAYRRADWDSARTQFSSALALSRSEADLIRMSNGVKRQLEQTDLQIEQRTSRQSARDRMAVFHRFYDEAVFYQSQYTGLEPDANLRASRSAARRALEQFHLKEPERAGLDVVPGHFDPAELRLLTTHYYELALFFADAIAQPLPGEESSAQARAALQVIAQVNRLRPPTAAIYRRRAAYLEKIGEPAQAERECAQADMLATANQSSRDDFLDGEEAYHSGDFKKAIQAFRRLLVREPDHFWGRYLLAICQLKEHRPAEAQAALSACQNRRPGFVWTYLLKGFAEGEMREFDLAEDDFSRAADLGLGETERYVMLVNRGVTRVRGGRCQDATEDFKAAIALKPEPCQAYLDLARAYQNMSRMSDALLALDRAVERAPSRAIVYRARAQLHRLRSENREALDDLDRATKLAGDDDPALAGDYLEKAIILDQAGRHREALNECEKAAAADPDRIEVHRTKGAILVKLKRYAEAIRAFDICTAKGKPAASLYEARGLALAYNGMHDRAIADYTLALCKGKRTASLLTHRGWVYLFSGAAGPAVSDFDEALRLDSWDDRALSGRALALVQQHKIPEALADARASIAQKSQDTRLVYNAARVYCQAAAAREARPERSKSDWISAGEYRAESLALIARSLSLLPEAERPRFWTQVIRFDPALGAIRKSKKYGELEAQFARPVIHFSAAGATSR